MYGDVLVTVRRIFPSLLRKGNTFGPGHPSESHPHVVGRTVTFLKEVQVGTVEGHPLQCQHRYCHLSPSSSSEGEVQLRTGYHDERRLRLVWKSRSL